MVNSNKYPPVQEAWEKAKQEIRRIQLGAEDAAKVAAGVASGGAQNPSIQPNVFRPSHYMRLEPEPVTLINAWGLGFNLGNAVKYIGRAGYKPGTTAVEDLEKAKRYIEIELECIRRREAVAQGKEPSFSLKAL